MQEAYSEQELIQYSFYSYAKKISVRVIGDPFDWQLLLINKGRDWLDTLDTAFASGPITVNFTRAATLLPKGGETDIWKPEYVKFPLGCLTPHPGVNDW